MYDPERQKEGETNEQWQRYVTGGMFWLRPFGHGVNKSEHIFNLTFGWWLISPTAEAVLVHTVGHITYNLKSDCRRFDRLEIRAGEVLLLYNVNDSEQ
jgi:hypothetical protein